MSRRRFWSGYLQIRIGSVQREVEGEPRFRIVASQDWAALAIREPTYHTVRIPWLRITLGDWPSPFVYGLYVEAAPVQRLEIGAETHAWRWRWAWWTWRDQMQRRGIFAVLDMPRKFKHGMGIAIERISG